MTLPAAKPDRAGEFISLFTQNSRQVYGYIRALVHHQSTYVYNGRRFRLTDVGGEVLTPILA